MSSKAVASLNGRIPKTPGSSRHHDSSLLSRSTRVTRKQQLNGYMISGSETDEHVQVRSVSHKSTLSKSVSSSVSTESSSGSTEKTEKSECKFADRLANCSLPLLLLFSSIFFTPTDHLEPAIFKSSNANFSKSVSVKASPKKGDTARGSQRSHLTAPRASRLNARLQQSPYTRTPEKKRPTLRQTKTEIEEDDIESQPLPSTANPDMTQSMQEGMVSTELTPVSKTPERPRQDPKTPKTWANWLQSISNIPNSVKKSFTGWTSRKTEGDDDDLSKVGRNLFGKKEDKKNEEEGEKTEGGKKKRYSLPGGFDDAVNGIDTAETTLKEKKEEKAAEAYANPYILMQDYKPKIKGKAVTVSLLSKAPTRTPPRTPARSIRGVESATGGPIPITPSRLRSSYHPYTRATPSRTPGRKEKEDKPLTAEEELEQIRQRTRERAIQQEKDLYRERKLARMLGKPIKDVDPKDLIGNQDLMSDTEEEKEQTTPPKRKLSEVKQPTTPRVNAVRKERRGYGLFDDSESEGEGFESPPAKRQQINTPAFAPVSLNKPAPSASFEEVSPDSDKENAFFGSGPVGPPPPAPQPAHAELPKPSALAAKPVPQTPVAQKKSYADKHKPVVPSSLRASQSANPSPPSAASLALPKLDFGSKAIITSSINNVSLSPPPISIRNTNSPLQISIENLFTFHFPPLTALERGPVETRVERDWTPSNKYVDTYMNVFATGVVA